MEKGKQRPRKTHTGCWTCRKRRVKCDEQAPACLRCQRFGVACEGYGIRLSWVNLTAINITNDDHQGADEVAADVPPRRALASVGTWTHPRMTSPEVDTTLSTIDEWQPGNQEPNQGGFSVFAAEPSIRLSLTPCLPPTSANSDHASRHVSPEWPVSPTGATSEPDADQPTSVDTVPAAETLLSLGSSAAAVEPSASANVIPSARAETGPSRHLDTLFMPASQKRLVHHWVTYTSRKLVLIDEPHNPCRIMMLPMALKGLTSSSRESNSNVAVFHALCASAASNLYELGSRKNEGDRLLAIGHEQQAISHLRNSLAHADSHRDQSFAMAIMACITADAISGTTQRWRTHVSGGLAYLAKLHARGLDETLVATFQKHMVSMAILCEVPVPKDLKLFLHDESASENLEFTFPYYGVSRSFLRACDKISALGVAVKTLTPELERELDAFQLQQYLDFPAPPPDDSSLAQKTHSLVLHHTAKVFYYARLVFFERSIRRSALDSVQSLVDLGIEELLAMERVGKGELGNMMLWPVVVLGAECATTNAQGKMTAWFKNQRRLGFRNLVVLEEMIRSLWTARRTGSANDIDWRDAIVLPHFDVFRL